MKRIYLIFAAVCCALAACTEMYDDTSIKESISSLEDRVSKLETKLNDEIAALKLMVEGQIVIESFDQENGRYTLHLSDGNSLVLYTADNNIPFITVHKVNGVSYWAYYVDGKVTSLQINGEGVKVVSSCVPKIRTGEDGYLEISGDDGKTWEKTDVKIETTSSPETPDPSPEVPSAGVFSSVHQEGDNLIFTLADGVTQYSVPIVKESEVAFVAFSGTQYFTAEQTKTVQVEMIGIEGYTITEKPEGWKAVLTDGELKVTAPAEGTGEASGYIKILGVGEETKIAKLYVTLGTAPCLVSIDDELEVTIKPNPTSCYYGACSMDEFDAAAIAQELSGLLPMQSRKPFTANKLVLPLTDLIQDIVEGETYVVWALPVTGEACVETDVVYQAVSSIGVVTEVKNVTFEDASISVRVKGTDTYYLVPMEGEMTLADVVYDLNGAYAATYDRYKHSSMYRGTLSDLLDRSRAGESYDFLVLPVKFGEILQADAKTFTVQLKSYTTGGSASVTLKKGTVDFTTFTTRLSGNSDTYKTISCTLSDSEYKSAGYAEDAALLTYLATLDARVYTSESQLTSSGLESGSTYWVLAVGVDETGALGTPERLEVQTKSVQYSDVTLSIGDLGLTQDSANVPLLATGGDIEKYRYMFLSSSDMGGFWYSTYLEDDDAAYEALIYGSADYQEVAASKVASGLTFSDLLFGTKYLFCVIGYDKDGKITNLAKTEIQPTVGRVITSDKPEWETARPEVSTKISSNTLRLNVTFAEGKCETFVVTMMSSEEYTANMPSAARQKADYVVGHSNAVTFEENVENYNPGWYIGSDKPYLLITWKDADSWYEPLVYDTETGTVLN